jgi:hypothetical protein
MEASTTESKEVRENWIHRCSSSRVSLLRDSLPLLGSGRHDALLIQGQTQRSAAEMQLNVKML